MTVVLLRRVEVRQSGPRFPNFAQWLAWKRERALVEPALKSLPGEIAGVGSRGAVLCAPEASSLATARRAFPDRKVEVSPKYGEPRISIPARNRLRLPAPLWATVAAWRLLWPSKQDTDANTGESPEDLKRRVVEAAARLIELSKKDGDCVLVGGPAFLRRVRWKLSSIGFVGTPWTRFKPGRAVRLIFQAARGPGL